MGRRVKPRILMSSALVALMALTAAPAGAETLADALVTAYQTSPLLAANRAALRSLDEGIPQARANRRPQLDLSAGGETSAEVEDIDEPIHQLQAALNASLLLFDNGQTKAAIESARNSIASGRADLKNVEQTVLFNAVQAYADVRRDEEFVKLASNDVQRLSETLDATRNRFDVGEVTRTDVSQSESRLAASRSTLASAQGSLDVSRESYRAAVGVPPRNLEVLPPLPALPKSLDEATNIGMQRNPSIISAQFAERAAVYDFDRAKAAKGLSISATASAGVQRNNSTVSFSGPQWDGATFGQVGVNASIPLYTGGRDDSLIRQAQAILEQRQHELQDEGRSVTESVGRAWSQLVVARASIVARREQAEAARIAAEGVAEEARLGARSTLDVLDADQERLQAEAEIVQAKRDEYVAAYGLLQAMGLLTVEHLKLGIETYNPDTYFEKIQNGPRGGYDTSAVDRIRARWEQ